MTLLLRSSALLIIVTLFTACETVEPDSRRDGARALLQFDFEGLKIGGNTAALKKFSNVQEVPSAITRDPRQTVYEIHQPNAYIPLAIAYFAHNRLYKLELRYFDGPSSRSLTNAGGWAFLRDYLIKRFGPPTQTGQKVEVATTQKGLNPAFAKANMQWLYPDISRKLNYIAMYDNGEGIAIVTLADTKVSKSLGQSVHEGTSRSSGRPGF